jgi:hypothetical protein
MHLISLKNPGPNVSVSFLVDVTLRPQTETSCTPWTENEASCPTFQRHLSLLAILGYILLGNRAIIMTCRAFISKNSHAFILLTGKALQHKIMTTDVWTFRTSITIYEKSTHYTSIYIYIPPFRTVVAACCYTVLVLILIPYTAYK